MSEDDDFIKEEFEWALKDPTEEKLRGLGEVVSTITKKLVEAISELQEQMYNLQTEVKGLSSKVDSLENRMTSLKAASVSTPSTAPAAIGVSKPKPASTEAPASASAQTSKPSGPMSMMGELKALLAARRKKAESGE